MLKKINLDRVLSKDEYKSQLDQLQVELGRLQRKAIDHNIPLLLLFEGWDAAGKGTLISKLIQALDPRGFQVYPINAPNEEELLRPFLWRFWNNTPARGRISIFDRSWYGRVSIDRVEGLIQKNKVKAAFHEIRDFEKQLTDDGTVIIKLFLHIDKKQQKKRFKEIEKVKALSWKVTKQDWQHHKQYNRYLEVIDEMIDATHCKHAPWTVIEAHDKRFAIIKLYHTVIRGIQQKLNTLQVDKKDDIELKPESINIPSTLDKMDLSLDLNRAEYKEQLDYYQDKIRKLEHKIYQKRIPVVIAYEGWDAGGKGGNIRRLTAHLDPRGYDVIPIAAPTKIELAHHYLWRFWKEFPKAGHIAIFDRTWYGRVLVERVEGFATETEWKRAYREINEMEQAWTAFGAVLVKFWLHLSPEEQLKRFEARQADPDKNWKITEEDWRNREKWDVYKIAIDDMVHRTSTKNAPWTIIEANSKYHARIKALKTVCEAIEAAL